MKFSLLSAALIVQEVKICDFAIGYFFIHINFVQFLFEWWQSKANSNTNYCAPHSHRFNPVTLA